MSYLTALDAVLAAAPRERFVIAGDGNQRIPRNRQPLTVAAELHRTFRDLVVATAGPLAPLDRYAIDHVAHTRDLAASGVDTWPENDTDGRPLTDHLGVQLRVALS